MNEIKYTYKFAISQLLEHGVTLERHGLHKGIDCLYVVNKYGVKDVFPNDAENIMSYILDR